MKKPALRLKKFNGDWNECVLKEKASFSKGFGYSKNDLTDTGHPIVLYGRLYTKYQTVISDIDTFVNVKEGSVLSQGNEVVIPASGECAEDIARASVIADKNIILGGDLNIVKPDKSLDSVFLALSISYGSAHSKLVSQSQGATIAHLHNAEIQNVVVSYPSDKAEQKAIGSFFTELDSLIEGKRVKLDKLKKLKLAYLGKMFPKKGSRVPEVRFKGFSGDWEEKKLSDYLTICPIVNSDNRYNAKDVLSVSGEFGVVNQIEFQGRSFAGASLLKYRVSETGTVIYTKSPLKANPYGIIKANKGPTGIVSVLYAVYVPNDNADADFVQVYFDDMYRLNSYLRTLVNKGAKNTLLISDEEALNGYVVFPSRPEQRKIAAFFNHLDNLINLQQQELDKLANIKSACLSKMFA